MKHDSLEGRKPVPTLPPARSLRFETPPPPHETAELRRAVRALLAKQEFEPRVDSWLSGWSPELSKALGQRGWLGMTWPKEYGGHERRRPERYSEIGEVLAAGAPRPAPPGAAPQTAPPPPPSGAR